MYTTEHAMIGCPYARKGRGGRVLYVGNLNLGDATNMETTEQRFTQIRAGRKKKRQKSQRERAGVTVKEYI